MFRLRSMTGYLRKDHKVPLIYRRRGSGQSGSLVRLLTWRAWIPEWKISPFFPIIYCFLGWSEILL